MAAIDPTQIAASSANVSTGSTQIRLTAAATAPPSVPSASTLIADTVKLSLAANVKLMHQQGVSPSVIASQLGISVKQVYGYIPGYNSAAPTASTTDSSSSDESTPAATGASTEPSTKQGAASQPQPPAAPTDTAGTPVGRAISAASSTA
jgi:hypothetical protein